MYFKSRKQAEAYYGPIDLDKLPNIHCSGSVQGMKNHGGWPLHADVVKVGQYVYCLSR